MRALREPCGTGRMRKFPKEGQDALSRWGGRVEVEGGGEERKLPTARQDGPYYAFKPLLKGVGRLFW